MTPDDVKLIFGNITEIAIFSDFFSQALEEALGDLLQGGKGDDHVGALFLSIVRVVFYIEYFGSLTSGLVFRYPSWNDHTNSTLLDIQRHSTTFNHFLKRPLYRITSPILRLSPLHSLMHGISLLSS